MPTAVGTGVAVRILVDGWRTVVGYLLAVLVFVQAVCGRRSQSGVTQLTPRAVFIAFALTVAMAVNLLVRQGVAAEYWLWGEYWLWRWILLAWMTALVAYAAAWTPPILAR